ncbi:MAG: PIN domain nuclease [Leptolyngbya sp.]|nr:MAG: PIN domain nuclease [Leptolyngbya sp.]
MIVLDTHAWIWWTNESTSLSQKALDAIEQTDLIGIPAISCWELAMLVSKGRVGLSMDVQVWIETSLQRPNVTLLTLTPQIAVLSTQLPGGFHGDPADRLIVASSLVHQSPLVSKDEKIQQWGHLQVIWS